MFASRGFRVSALFATLVMAFSMVAVDTAEARRGGSFGSRGMRTERTVPATQTAPNATTPVQRTMTDSSTQRNAAGTAAPAARPGLFGGIGGAIIGGLLFSGLFGMLFGGGFGGFGGMLALLVQVAIIGLIVSFFLRRRQQRPAMAGGGPLPFEAAKPAPNFGGGGGGNASARAPRSGASQRAGRRDEIGISDADLGGFESQLVDLQDAYSREDYAALRAITTPEVMGYLAEELAENATKGVRNEVFDVKLLAGDVAEAWREGNADYASVAMRYEFRDVTRDRASGEIVSGSDSVTETAEIWTFVRQNGGRWLVSAIQEA